MRPTSRGILMSPELEVGAPFPDVYADAHLRAYRARPETVANFVLRAAEQKAKPHVLLALAAPMLAMSLVLLLAFRGGERRS